MGKLLFWFFIVLLTLFAARLAARQTRPPAARPRGASGRAAETMVRCARCGIHLPRSEAILQDGDTWCGPEHARSGPAAQ